VLSANALQGLQDTLQVLAEQLPASPVPELAKKIRLLQDALRALTLDGPPQTLAAAASALDEIHRIGGELVAWLPADIDIDGELVYWARAFDRQSRALRDELEFLVPASWQGSAIPTRMELAGAGAAGTARRRSSTIDRR
jgi:cyclic beta-1,2-glucan synthetase